MSKQTVVVLIILVAFVALVIGTTRAHANDGDAPDDCTRSTQQYC